jgi:hypothetical protein
MDSQSVLARLIHSRHRQRVGRDGSSAVESQSVVNTTKYAQLASAKGGPGGVISGGFTVGRRYDQICTAGIGVRLGRDGVSNSTIGSVGLGNEYSQGLYAAERCRRILENTFGKSNSTIGSGDTVGGVGFMLLPRPKGDR